VAFVLPHSSRCELYTLSLHDALPIYVSWVMVHDAARPLFSRDLALRVYEAAREHLAAVCGISITDTVKAVKCSLAASYTRNARRSEEHTSELQSRENLV